MTNVIAQGFKSGLLLLLTALCVTSCKEKSHICTIYGNADIDTIPISAGMLVPLETTDSSLIYEISNMEKAADRLIIHSRDLLKSFDPYTGKYLGTIASKGNGPGEYAAISQMWVDTDTICVLDYNIRSLHRYAPDGTFISSNKYFIEQDATEQMTSGPVYLMKLPGSEYYVSLNCFTDGTTESNPTASLYDTNFKYLRDIEGRSLLDGGTLTDRMTPDVEGKRLLMWEALKDTLFTITPDGVKPWLAFDMGEHKLPAEIQNEPETFKRLYSFFTEKDANYISLFHAFQKQGDILYFSASSTDKNNYLCRLDLNGDKMKLYKIADSSGRYKSGNCLKLLDGKLYIDLTDTESEEANPVLFVIDPNRIK